VLTRSHGLGNDYLVCDPAELPVEITPARVRLLCDRHEGVGSDGLLVLQGRTGLRIFNPDGSEAEKSGNGLRIFARWLYDTHRVTSAHFAIGLGDGSADVTIDGDNVIVDMGIPTFRDDLTHVDVANESLSIVALSIGNPHCVVLRESLSEQELRQLGPLIENNPAFPNRTNVQFAHVLDRSNVELLIWERGAGETRASGSSTTADCGSAAPSRRSAASPSAPT
jgi:diaminopimelate epimerase